MMCEIMRTVVVLPFVPVTATIGTGDVAPAGNSMSTTARPTWRGCPSVGLVCIRNPGPALTSTMAPPVWPDRLGDVGRDEVDAGNIQPDDHGRLTSDFDIVRMDVVGPVDRGSAGAHVAGLLEHAPSDRQRGRRQALSPAAPASPSSGRRSRSESGSSRGRRHAGDRRW